MVLGSALGAATVQALGAAEPFAIAWPVGRLLLVVALATAAGLIAGMLPARRAARLVVLAAVVAQ
ncbi:hypothetical protein [Georgenia sp. AZ-5]|uniref:hypothetical protein n=1 Tax=Georgenia sp. AZ-5 TaxID=3367526 RepID=UPI003753E93E